MGCLGRLILFSVFLGFIGYLMDDDDTKSKSDSTTQSTQEFSNKTNSPPTPDDTIEIPSSQQAFIEFHKRYSKSYREAKNELKKSALRNKRKEELESTLGNNLHVEDWIGTIDKEPATTTKGNAYISVILHGSNIHVSIDNNEFTDLINETLIPIGSSLFDTVSEMGKGTRIIFSGLFFRDQNNKDYLDERSVTESGSMEEPEFNFKFTEIQKYS